MIVPLSDLEAIGETPVNGRKHTVWGMRSPSEDASVHDTGDTVKIMHTRELSSGTVSKDLGAIRSELKLLASVQRHPNILRYHGLLHWGDNDEEEAGASSESAPPLTNMWMVVENCIGGDLLAAVMERRLCERRGKNVIKGVLTGLVHVHDLGILHRDIKPENIMLANDDRPVISDFGVATHMSDAKEMVRRCGSPGYVAPEVIMALPYGMKVDVFSTGVLLYFVLSGNLPFFGTDVISVIRRTIRCRLSFDLPQFENISIRCKMFIASLALKIADDRPDATAALDDPWFTF